MLNAHLTAVPLAKAHLFRQGHPKFSAGQPPDQPVCPTAWDELSEEYHQAKQVLSYLKTKLGPDKAQYIQLQSLRTPLSDPFAPDEFGIRILDKSCSLQTQDFAPALKNTPGISPLAKAPKGKNFDTFKLEVSKVPALSHITQKEFKIWFESADS